MITAEENELLVRTGPGTMMGNLFRRFWIPAALSEELPGPDCPPLRVTLLGEKLIAFRDSGGRVGLIDRYCCHRGADLFFGRNEENGLRCVFHGWKFDVGGHCVDVPNAKVGQAFRDKCQLKSYPTVESGGMVWAYMGPPDTAPALPQYAFLQVPAGQFYTTKIFVEGNYMQCLEGEADSGHVSFLHRFIGGDGSSAGSTGGQNYVNNIPHIDWEIEDTDYGLMMAARRDLSDGRGQWRANLFQMPHTVPVATPPGVPMTCHIRVPIDDDTNWLYRVRWHPDRDLTGAELAEYRHGGLDFPEVIPGTYMPKENRTNDFLIDRANQQRFTFTGIRSLPAQDMAVQTEQFGGMASDRTNEHLVSADKAVIALRNKLIRSARELAEGIEPRELKYPEAYNVRALDVVIPDSMDWKQGMLRAMSNDLPWDSGQKRAVPA